MQRAAAEGKRVTVTVTGWTDPRPLDPSCLYTGPTIPTHYGVVRLDTRDSPYISGDSLVGGGRIAFIRSKAGGNYLPRSSGHITPQYCSTDCGMSSSRRTHRSKPAIKSRLLPSGRPYPRRTATLANAAPSKCEWKFQCQSSAWLLVRSLCQARQLCSASHSVQNTERGIFLPKPRTIV